LLSKSKLESDVTVSGNGYKAGENIEKDDLLNVNRFMLNSVVKAFSQEVQDEFNSLKEYFQNEKKNLKEEHDAKLQILKKDDILPSGVVKLVKVYIATKRKLKVGDKMAGRHGNKGIVSNIVPEVDMPYLKDGKAVEVCLNPLGVPSRMNIGQILEVHLGLVGKRLGDQIEDIFIKKQGEWIKNLREKMISVGNVAKLVKAEKFINSLSDEELLNYARDWAKGVKFSTPIGWKN